MQKITKPSGWESILNNTENYEKTDCSSSNSIFVKDVAEILGEENTLKYKKHWSSNNLPKSWIQIDLKESKKIVGYYFKKSEFFTVKKEDQTESLYPTSWILQGSDDGIIWKQIDIYFLQNQFLKDHDYLYLELKQPFITKYIRLSQVGLNSIGSNTLAIGGFDVFTNSETSDASTY